MWGDTTECVTEKREKERFTLKHTDGELDQCHRPGSSRLLLPIHSARAQAALHSQRPRLITALMWGGLMLAQANAKGMQAFSTHPLPPSLSEIKRLAAQTKTVKVQALGVDGCYWPLRHSNSLARCVSPPLCLFPWLSLTMSGLSGVVQRQPPLMECYYVVPVSIWPEADCTYFPWSCVHLSLTYNAFYCVCACVCVSVCNIMTRIRSAAWAPELSSQPTIGFCNICPIHPDPADLFDTNVYFPAEHYDVR